MATTDATPKLAERSVDTSLGEIRVGGIAKGAGMIRPDLGTMIAVLLLPLTLDVVLLPITVPRDFVYAR